MWQNALFATIHLLHIMNCTKYLVLMLQLFKIRTKIILSPFLMAENIKSMSLILKTVLVLFVFCKDLRNPDCSSLSYMWQEALDVMLIKLYDQLKQIKFKQHLKIQYKESWFLTNINFPFLSHVSLKSLEYVDIIRPWWRRHNTTRLWVLLMKFLVDMLEFCKLYIIGK